ncbi:hypothetical protein WDW37_17610 [Bdellovibrionota bacterium FG-1]
MHRERRKTPPPTEGETNYVQQLFYAVFRKFLPNWSDVVEFSKKSGINLNTLRDVYYKDGLAGISTINRVLKALLNLTPKKVDSLVNLIENIEPVSDATRVWNSIDASDAKKKYYALIAKSVWEIDRELEKQSNRK